MKKTLRTKIATIAKKLGNLAKELKEVQKQAKDDYFNHSDDWKESPSGIAEYNATDQIGDFAEECENISASVASFARSLD